MGIRVLLRSRADGRFVSGTGAWSPHMGQARVFASAKAANEFSSSQKLSGMELVIVRDKGPELRVPLDFRASR